MSEYILSYPEYDLIVNGKKCKDCVLISKYQLPNGLLPNQSNRMYLEGNLYKVESISMSQIILFIIAIIYLLVAMFLLLYGHFQYYNITQSFNSNID